MQDVVAYLTPANLVFLMGASFFPVGLLSICTGLIILAVGPYSREAQSLAAHSVKISQKGLTDNVSLVAQSATELINSVNALIRTSSGNAMVLIAVGAAFEAASYFLLTK
jgi:hypothetical protein